MGFNSAFKGLIIHHVSVNKELNIMAVFMPWLLFT